MNSKLMCGIAEYAGYPSAGDSDRRAAAVPGNLARGLIVAVLLASLQASAAVAFRSPQTVSSVSLRIPMMAGAKIVPLPPPRTFRYKVTAGQETWHEDRYDAYELWFAEQYLSEWVNQAGIRVVLGVVHSVYPLGVTEKHVTQDHFQSLLESEASQISQVDATLLQRWMGDFAGIRVGKPRSLMINRSRFAELLEFPTEREEVHAFVFRMDLRRAGQSHVPAEWFSLVVTTPGRDIVREKEAVRRQLLGGIEATGRFDNRSTSSRFAQRDNMPEVRQHPSRDSARRSIQHLNDWWSFDSEDYIALSNHREARRFIEDLLETLQSARLLYAALVPPLALTSTDVSVVRLPATDGEYTAYVGAGHAWSSGVFDASRRELIIRPSALGARGARNEALLRVALHEGFHQYLFQATGHLQAAPWFNEGHATFFEESDLTSRRLMIGENATYAAVLERLVSDRQFSLRPFLAMGYRDFYAGSDNQRRINYSVAWGLIYYLQRGAPLERNRPYRTVLNNYMTTLVQTGSSDRATLAAFEAIDGNAFERSFIEFWKSSRLRNAARRAPLQSVAIP